jgi:TonB family protein
LCRLKELMPTSSLPPDIEERSAVYASRHVVPVLVLEFDDERTRGRMREAGLLSIIVHLAIFIALLLSPKWMPKAGVQLFSADDLVKQRELTYLNLPPDEQKLTKRPNTNIISDKDRIATSKRPTIDRKTLKELMDSSRPGSPKPPGPPAVQSPPQVAQQASPPAPQAQTSQQPAAPAPAPQNNNQVAKLEIPPNPAAKGGAFKTPAMSPGSVIEQAARAAAANRIAGGGGASGDYGLGPLRGGGNVQSNLDIMSDTMGVDFGPYLQRVLHDVRNNWYNLIPEVARPPWMKRGKVSIEFAILKDGSVAGLTLRGPSGDVSLDRAAWGGITASNPFPPLPKEFQGNYLALRFHFFYNPDQNDLR